MNWNYWLPWREYPQDSEDSSCEDEVIQRCEHDFEQSSELRHSARMTEAVFEDGYLVVPQYELVEEFCTKCGKPGYKGQEVESIWSDYAGERPSGEWLLLARRLAFKPDFEMDPDVNVSDAITDVVEPEADYVAMEDGEITTVEDEDGAGRVLVNQSDEAEYGVTD